jgi:hypothetical protein
MARTRTTVYDLVADDIALEYDHDTNAVSGLTIDGAVIDFQQTLFRTRLTDDRADRIAALERLSELALQAASELRTDTARTDTTEA